VVVLNTVVIIGIGKCDPLPVQLDFIYIFIQLVLLNSNNVTLSNIKVIIFACVLIGIIIYLLFHKIAYKNIFSNLKQNKYQRYGFYECGFRQRHEYNIRTDINLYFNCALFILYEVECIFLIIFFTNLHILSVLDVILILFYIILFLVGIYFESTVKNTN